MNDDLVAEMHRVAASRWNLGREELGKELEPELPRPIHDNAKPLFGGVVEGNKIYVYKVNGPVSAQSIHEAYRQATRKRLRRQRRRLLHTIVLLIAAGLIGLWSLSGWVPQSVAVLAGIAGLVAIVLIWWDGGKKKHER